MTSDDFYHEMGDNAKDPQMYRRSDNEPHQNQTVSIIDISNEIEQKTDKGGSTELYYQSEKIGEARQDGNHYMYEMAEGFEFKNNKFYQKADK